MNINIQTLIRTAAAILLAAVCAHISAAEADAPAIKRDSQLTASFVTCWPGSEIYELVGHEALRIRGIDENGLPVDSVWNYGVFDFNEPNFVYRFVKGETDYMVAGYPFSWFMPEYVMRHSKVAEQDLNLSQEQVRQMRRNLQIASLPQNARYRYNYIRDNCSTRVVDNLYKVASDSVTFTEQPKFTSFRNAMRYYHRNYPWYQFGIDLVLGPGLDGDYGVREETFAPVQLHALMDSGHFSDGRPLVKQSRVLYEGREDAVLPPTPWYLTPMAMAVAVLIISIGVALWQWRTGRIARWWYALTFGATGIVGCIIFFLYFFSLHAATSPNILIIWLNPLLLLVPIFIWWRKTHPVVMIVMWLNLAVTALLLISWPMQAQSGNPAFFPLMGADIILAASYAIFSKNDCYNKSGTIIAVKKSGNQGRKKSAPRPRRKK